jgi:endonuclease YncB( thermonuclease family)
MRALAIALCLIATPALANVTGPARVIDGDTLEIQGERVRLHGIDAPETGQVCSLNGKPWSCGRAATDLLRDLIGGREVDCRSLGRDRYGRMIGKCKVGRLDLGAEMVTRGMAVAYLRYSQDYLQTRSADTIKASGSQNTASTGRTQDCT